MQEMGIITVSGKGQIVLPKKIRNRMKISQGSKMLVVAEKDEINLKKLENSVKKRKAKESFSLLLASEKSLAKDWLSEEEERAWANL